jgi:hypothetical protein
LEFTGLFAISYNAFFVSSSNFFQMVSNFFYWVCSHIRSNNLNRVLFLNCLWKFAFKCLTHYLLLTCGHNGSLYRFVLPSFMSLIACKMQWPKEATDFYYQLS